MSRGWRRWWAALRAASRTSFRLPKALRSWLRFEALEDRLVPAFASPPDHLLPAADALAVAAPRLDADGLADLAVLGRTGRLTTALNTGLDSWLPSTIDLGEPNPAGFAFGTLDRDPFADAVIQTPDGLLVGTGDGRGRFGGWRHVNPGPAGAFTAGAGIRVEPAVGYLAGDTFADVVTVAPGTNEVVVLKGDGAGGFAPAVRFASGGVAPVSVLVGNFVGDAAPDLAVGHRDGSVTFFRGNADGTFTPRPGLTVTGLGTITGLSSADVDGDGELDVAVSGTDRAAWLHNAHDPAPQPAIVNGDFSQGLTGWTRTSGAVSAGGGYAEFREDRSALLSTIRQTFTVPAGVQHLTFDLAAYGIEDPAGGVPDAFEAALLGPDNRPLVPAFRPGASAFVNLGPGHTVGLGSGASFDGTTVTLDLSGVAAGTAATLVFDLAGSPPGTTSVVGIDNVALDPSVQYDDRFTAVPLAGPFAAAGGVAAADVDGDGTTDLVVADGTRAVLFNGTGGGALTRTEYPATAWGTGLSAVAVGPMTAGDAVADAALGLSAGAVTPLTVSTAAVDKAPRLQPLAPLSGTEGSAVALTAAFADPDGGGPYTATIDWGDGSAPSVVPATFANGQGAVTAAHTYADNGAYPVRVLVRSANNGPADYQDTTATVANAAPAVAPLTIGVQVGDDTEVSVATFTDPGFSPADFRTRETFLATIDWGDGSPHPFGRLAVVNGGVGTATAGTAFGSHRYAAVGTYTGSVTVTDDDGGTTTVPLTVVVSADGPVIRSATDLAASEGSAVTFYGTFTDPTVGDAHTAAVAWGDGTSSPGAISYAGNGTWAVTASHTYADDGTYPVTLAVTDRAGHTATRAASAVVSNVAPVLTPAADQVVPADHAAYVALGTFSDPGFSFDPAGTHETFHATVDFGDGTAPYEAVVYALNGSAGTPTTGTVWSGHSYTRLGTFTVTVTLYDDDGGTATATLHVTARTDPPAVTSAPDVSAAEGQPVTFAAAFTDPDPNGPYTATVDWGDGTTSTGTTSYVNGSGTVTAPHVYADNGSYPITLTLANRFGVSTTAHAAAAVSNVPPAVVPAADQSVQAGQALSLTLATFSDPGFSFDPAGTHETFPVTVTWGDGTAPQSVNPTVVNGSATAPTSGTVSGSHTYVSAGTYTVAVTVADDDGGSATATFHVTVTSPPPAGLGCYPAASPVITGISRATTTGTGTATTGDPTLVLSGTGEPGSTLTINRQGVGAVGTTVVGADGTWRFDYTGTALAAGSYTFTADQAPFGPLGVAETFNGFVIQDVGGIPDAEGRLAAGGNVTLSNFSVGQLLSSSNGMRDDLIAGGSLNLTGGTVYKGNAVYGTTRSVSSSTTLSQGAVRKESVINFAAADTYLRGRADAWAALAATGTTTYTATGSTWAVALSGSNPTFNVFAVDGTKLSACSGFTITAPAGSTVLVNVSGTSGSVKNFAFTLAGVDKQHVLFNFAQYTSLTIASVGVAGSVLAPRAAVTFTSGSIDGTLVAKSLTGGGELHHFPLLSSCPVASSAPFVVTVQSPVSAPTAKFFVVGAGQGGRYSDTGAYQGANPLANTSGTPVGIAANSGGTATWVAVANADGTTDVWGYDRDGSLRTRWRAYGVTDARDVATDGTDVWVVGKDSATNAPKVFRYTKGASVRTGGLEPASSFALNTGNTNPTGLATDGSNVFVTDKNAQGGRVFAYDVNGNLEGNSTYNPWRLDAANANPTGVALNPAGGSDLWVVDGTTKKVYRYANGRNNQYWNSGGPQAATSTFNLDASSPAPTGIADPLPPGWNPAAAPPTAAHTPPSGIDFAALKDFTPLGRLDYQTTYYSWEANELRVDARLTNVSAAKFGGLVVASLDGLTPGVGLASADGTTPGGSPYVAFGPDELGAGGPAPGESGAPVTLRFDDVAGLRFDYAVSLLAPANRPPAFTTAANGGPVVAGGAYAYDADAADPDGDPLTYTVVTGPAGMTINSSTGVVTWAPSAADVGTQAVTVRASDGRGGTAEQSFDLIVRDGGNHAPVIRSTPTTTAVLPGGTFTYPVDAVDPDGDPLSYAVVSGPAGVGITSGGLLTWPAGTTPGDYPVALTVTDGRGGEASQGFVVTVTSADPGAIQGVKFRYFNGESGAVLSGPNLVVNGDFSQGNTGFFTELHYQTNGDLFPESTYYVGTNPRNYHPFATSFGDHTTGSGLMMIINGATRANTTVWEETVPVEPGTAYAFGLWAASWTGGAPAKIHITINGVQVGPDLQLPSQTALWKQFAVTWLSGAQTTADIRVVNLETAAGGNDFVLDDIALGIPGVPNWTVYLDQNGNHKLDAGERSTVTAADGTYAFTGLAPGGYVVNEVQRAGWVQVSPASGSNRVTVGAGQTVTGVDFGNRQVAPSTNQPPAFGNTAPTAATVGQFYRFDPLVTDPDGEAAVFDLVNPPAGMTVDRDTGTVTWVPALDQVGPASATLRARDGAGATATLPLSITVSAPARGFAITSTPPRFATVGDAYTYAVTTTAPASQPAVFTLVDPPAGMRIDDVSGVLTWTAAAGTYRVTIRANDPAGSEAFQSYVLAVRPVNTPPVVTPPPDSSVVAGGAYRDRATAADPADGFRFSLAPGAPAGLAIDPPTGVLTWATHTGDAGVYPVTVVATDDRGLSGSAAFTLTVLADTTAPQVRVTADPDLTAAGTPVTVTVRATDDAGVVSRTLAVNGVALTLNAAGQATFTPTVPGVYTFAATATDAAGNTGTATARLKVTDPADTDPPVVTVTSPQPGALVSNLTDVVGTITDANLDYYRVEVSRFGTNDWRPIGGGYAVPASGVLAVFDPTLLETDEYLIRVTAADINGLSSSVEVAVELTGQAKIGNFREEFTDLQVPLAGVPITITRVYDSLAADRSSDFGFGWSLGAGFDPRVHETVPTNPAESILGMFAAVAFKAGTRVYVTDPDGRRVGFTFEPKPYEGVLNSLSTGAVSTAGFYMPYFKPDGGVFDRLQGEFDGFGTGFPLPLIRSGDRYYLAAIGVAYNPVGYRLTTKDGLSYHFGQGGGVQDVTDRNGVRLTFTRDGIASSLGTSVSFHRDAQGRIDRITDPAGKFLTYRYDAGGNLVGAADQESKEETYEYTDPLRPHFLSAIRSLCGCYPSVRMEYDDGGRLIGQVNNLDQATTFGYDPTHFTETATDPLLRTTTFVYDERGNVLSETDPLNHTTTHTYDANDNETGTTDPLNHTTTRTYDDRGNVLTVTDPGNNTWTFTYNAFNLPTALTDARHNVSTLDYDPQGRPVRFTDPEGGVREHRYDSAGRLTAAVDQAGRTTTYGYGTALAAPTRTTYGDGTSSQAAYNWLGEVTSEVDPRGDEQLSVYDDTGRLLANRDADQQWTLFTYDSNDRLETVTDPDGNTTSYGYDDADRRTSETTTDGTRTWTFDAAGEVTRSEDRDGRVITYRYDPAGRLEEEDWYASAAATVPVNVVHYTYDDAGNPTEVWDASSHTTFAYDERDLLVTEDNAGTPGVPHVVLTNRYDAAGNLIETADDRGTRVTSTYDRRNWLVGRTWDGPDVGTAGVSFGYDGAGNLTRVDRTLAGAPAGSTELRYDPAGQLVRIVHAGANGAVFADYGYGYDAAGQLTDEARPGQTASYGYDPEGQLVSAVFTGQASETYAYDAAGNRVGGGQVVGANNRLLADDRFTYRYDSEGNLIGKTETATGEVTTYTYDPRNRLTDVVRESAGGVVLSAVHYRYDALDRLIARDVDGAALYTVYAGDVVWADFTGAGDVAARYLYGDGADALLARWRPHDGLAWYLTDRLGSVRDVTNAAGTAVVNHVEYTAFGRVVSQSNPAAGDRFLFAGREYEAAIGLYFNRARFYDPGTGRFVGEDPVGFESGMVNQYAYAGSAPTNLTDPTGLSPIGEDGILKKIQALQTKVVKCLGTLVAARATETAVYIFFFQIVGSFAVYGGQGPALGSAARARNEIRFGRAIAEAMAKSRNLIQISLKNSTTPAQLNQIEKYILDNLKAMFSQHKNVTLGGIGKDPTGGKGIRMRRLLKC